MAKGNKAEMSADDFTRILYQLIDEQHTTASQLLDIPGVYEIVAEQWNNEVIEAWEFEQACEDYDREGGEDDDHDHDPV